MSVTSCSAQHHGPVFVNPPFGDPQARPRLSSARPASVGQPVAVACHPLDRATAQEALPSLHLPPNRLDPTEEDIQGLACPPQRPSSSSCCCCPLDCRAPEFDSRTDPLLLFPESQWHPQLWPTPHLDCCFERFLQLQRCFNLQETSGPACLVPAEGIVTSNFICPWRSGRHIRPARRLQVGLKGILTRKFTGSTP